MFKQFLRRILRLSQWQFVHPKGGKVIVWARTRTAARNKLRKAVVARMFGNFALHYNPVAVDEVIKEFRDCK